MKRSTGLTLMLGLSLAVVATPPAAAHWDDVHYHLTYNVVRLNAALTVVASRLGRELKDEQDLGVLQTGGEAPANLMVSAP